MNQLRGRRLTLRTLTCGDAEEMFAAVASSRDLLKRRLRWVAAVASSEDCRAFVLSAAEAAGRGEREAFAVVESRSNALVGVAALHGMRAIPGLAELCFWIRADRQGRGYGAEAGRVLSGYAFRRDVLHKLYARIDPSNRIARKTLQNIGFRYEGCLRDEKRLNGRWIDQECWGMLRKEWKK